MIAAALLDPKAFWYLTRGTGIVALLLLTASVALGVLTTARWRSPRWPRFALGGLHKHLTLLSVALVAVHVLTTVADGYAPVRIRDAFLPFASRYRPVWLGLGAVAFDLLLALVLTSLLRARIGHRLWRRVHWLAYACWPVALVHALGTGSDARAGFMLVAGLAPGGDGRRLGARSRLVRHRRRTTPARARCDSGARRPAGDRHLVRGRPGPARLGEARRHPGRRCSPRTRRPCSRRCGTAPTVSLPTTRFASTIKGRISESSDAERLVHVVIAGTLTGGPGGSVRIDLARRAARRRRDDDRERRVVCSARHAHRLHGQRHDARGTTR